MRTESELVHIATMHIDDKVAIKAMKELRERFDATYTWCNDCDGLATKESECCLNTMKDNDTVDFDISFP